LFSKHWLFCWVQCVLCATFRNCNYITPYKEYLWNMQLRPHRPKANFLTNTETNTFKSINIWKSNCKNTKGSRFSEWRCIFYRHLSTKLQPCVISTLCIVCPLRMPYPAQCNVSQNDSHELSIFAVAHVAKHNINVRLLWCWATNCMSKQIPK